MAMINVSIWRDRAGSIRRFRVEGHSGYAEYGSDIVCSAVSALAQTAVFGLEQVAGLEIEVEVDSERGILDCRIVSPVSQAADKELVAVKQSAILETMVIGFSQIAVNYRDFVQVHERKY